MFLWGGVTVRRAVRTIPPKGGRERKLSMAGLHAPGWVAGGVSQGLSARESLRIFREAGGSIRDSVWNKLYAEQRATYNAVRDEMTKPLSSIPTATEIQPMTTKRRTGYLQTVEVYTRVRGTDIVSVRPFMFTTDSLMSRGEAVTRALTLMQQGIDEGRYEELLLGGVYTGSRRMAPGALE